MGCIPGDAAAPWHSVRVLPPKRCCFALRPDLMTPDLSRRSNLTELMDSDETDFATFRDCLVDLAKVNTLTLAYRPTLQFFDRLAKTGRLPKDRAAIVVDVGSGFGDVLRAI